MQFLPFSCVHGKACVHAQNLVSHNCSCAFYQSAKSLLQYSNNAALILVILGTDVEWGKRKIFYSNGYPVIQDVGPLNVAGGSVLVTI